MLRPVLFDACEYSQLTADERSLLVEGYQHAVAALRKNVTPLGFSACSMSDNSVVGSDANYRSVWARDGAKCVAWTAELDDEEIRDCQRRTLTTILDNQGPAGQLPAYVAIDDGRAEYGGVGGITSIDSALWMYIAFWEFCRANQDFQLLEQYFPTLEKTMNWLGSLDANNCGMLEIPEAGDWTDLFSRSYHVLYDEVLWFRALVHFARMLRKLGDEERAVEFEKRAGAVQRVIIKSFWPSTATVEPGHGPQFSDVQYELGDARYLVAQVSPFSYSWRCDVYGNILAFLANLLDKDRALMTFRFLWGVGANDPAPVKNVYPPIQSGDPEWRDYFTVNLLNLPNHYHNGGVWPFIGGLWVRYVHKLGMTELACRELVKLATMCSRGVSHEWEFNEWHHGITGRPMGKMFQAWSAASFIRACLDLHIDPGSQERV